MLVWLKRNVSIVVGVLVTIGFLFYAYSCEPKVASLLNTTKKVNRQELQLELDQLIGLAQLRMVDLDKQEQFRAIILENAVLLVQGQPINPVGIITGLAAIYGATQGGRNITKVVKEKRIKRKESNGHT